MQKQFTEVDMHLRQVKLVTIIALDSLEKKILEEFTKLEISGFTICDAVGQGLHSQKMSDWEGKNIRIETLVSEEKANKLLQVLYDKYLKAYGVVTFVTNVEVLRPEKFN